MSIERTFYCDAPGCEVHVRTMAKFPICGFIRTLQDCEVHHFCSWDCVLKYAATMPPTEILRMDDHNR